MTNNQLRKYTYYLKKYVLYLDELAYIQLDEISNGTRNAMLAEGDKITDEIFDLPNFDSDRKVRVALLEKAEEDVKKELCRIKNDRDFLITYHIRKYNDDFCGNRIKSLLRETKRKIIILKNK